MTARTRYFVISSLLVLTVGLGAGLVAYYFGLPGLAISGDGPVELAYVPRDAAVVAYAEVRNIMVSPVRQSLRQAVPTPEDGQQRFQERTGIDVESDIDHVVAFLQPQSDGETPGAVVARGRFSDVKIEALMRERGAEVESYGGKRLIVQSSSGTDDDGPMALSFLEPGLIAVGSAPLVKAAIDAQRSGENVVGNEEVMEQLRSLEPGNAWALGRVDALQRSDRLPPQLAGQLPAIAWFAASGTVDSDVRGVLRADARDEQAAENLREVARGFLALARMQAGSRPELQAVAESLELGGVGRSVVLSFSIRGDTLEALTAGERETAEPPPSQ
jgi:hypothetical protein